MLVLEFSWKLTDMRVLNVELQGDNSLNISLMISVDTVSLLTYSLFSVLFRFCSINVDGLRDQKKKSWMDSTWGLFWL